MTFENNKRYIFDFESCRKSMEKIGNIDIEKKGWTGKCDGKEVEVLNPKMGRIGIYNIHPDWCKEIKTVKYIVGTTLKKIHKGAGTSDEIGKIVTISSNKGLNGFPYRFTEETGTFSEDYIDENYVVYREEDHLFKVGDIVRGTIGNPYSITTEEMNMGRVVGISETDPMKIDILPLEFNGSAANHFFAFPVDAKYFDLVKAANVDPVKPDIAGDTVNHPSHYTQYRVEVIDIIEDATQGLEGGKAVALGNTLKYLLRFQHKNGKEDLLKAKWYLERLISIYD